MKKYKLLALTLAITIGLGGAVVFAPEASAINVFEQCKADPSSSVCKAQSSDDATSMIQTVINILLYIIGIIAVIMIIVGGIRYTVSNGNASQTKEAKDTILYAVVGLIIAIMSYAIVNFVVSWF